MGGSLPTDRPPPPGRPGEGVQNASFLDGWAFHAPLHWTLLLYILHYILHYCYIYYIIYYITAIYSHLHLM
jgi:hypothetical protein